MECDNNIPEMFTILRIVVLVEMVFCYIAVGLQTIAIIASIALL